MNPLRHVDKRGDILNPEKRKSIDHESPTTERQFTLPPRGQHILDSGDARLQFISSRSPALIGL